MRSLTVALVAALGIMVLAGAPALAQDPAEHLRQAQESCAAGQMDQAYAQTEAAAVLLWQKLPLTVENLTLTTQAAQGYGLFTPRPDNVFKTSGDPVSIYMEVLGCDIQSTGQDAYHFSLAMDFALLDDKNQVLMLKDGFLTQDLTSRRFNRQIYLTVRVDLNEVPPGDYTIALQVRDILGKKQKVVKIPVVFGP